MSEDGIGLRLNAEAERLMTTLEQLGTRLRDTMTVDVNEHGSPTRDWCRVLGHYRGGIQNLLVEQRERTKLKLMAQAKSGPASFTDEDFEHELRDLGREAIKRLTSADLEAEMRARGIVVVVPAIEEEDE